MNEELNELTAESINELEMQEIAEDGVEVEDLEQNVELEEEIEVVEVEIVEEVEIEIDEAVGWTGGDSTRHYSLSGRDEANQHPISAITGLELELDKLNALKTVVSDKIGVANYYKWNEGAYNEYGYFVSLVPNTSTIKICEGTDIFGITVDDAGFVGNQDKDVSRDNSYALVATTGLVDVRCELDVTEGNYVVSNGHGIAEKTTSGCGYKVIAVNDKRGVLYASIALGVQACTTDVIDKSLQRLEARVDDNEINIAAAMNVANDAYNKSIESDSVSEEAILKALEALAQANDAVDATDEMNKILESTNNTASQAKAIAEGAVAEAESIRKVAYDTANDALSNVNALIEDLKPITQWEDPISGNTGAEYLTTYIDNGLATKVEVQTVEKVTEENKSWIAKSGESIAMAVSSVDKYSVGEYSQAYGLTLEQAKNILKEGMIYIPTKHGDISTHTETYSDDVDYSFTHTFYYVWTNNMWSEGIGEVWFGAEQPSGDTYAYWYDDDRLYLLNNGIWTEVATLAGNANNRITSMIRQDVDEVRAEVVNAYGGVAGFGAKLSDTEAKVNSIASWPTDGGTHNMAVLEQKADASGSYMTLAAVTNIDGKSEVTELSGAKIVLNDSTRGSFVEIDADNIVLGGETTFTTTEKIDGEDVTKINGATIATGTLSASQITTGTLDASKVTVTNLDASQITTGTLDAGFIEVDDLKAFDATIGGFKIAENSIQHTKKYYDDNQTGVYIGTDGIGLGEGKFYVTDEGDMNTISGMIGGWTIDSQSLYNYSTYSTGLCSLADDVDECFDSDDVLTFEFDNATSTYKITACVDTATDVKIPPEYNGHPVTVIDESAFSGCISLTSVTIPGGITSIGKNAFYGCSNLVKVTMRYGVINIGADAFTGCENLVGVVIPDSVTSIGENAFDYCERLEILVIPSSVVEMECQDFTYCDNLTVCCKAESQPKTWNSGWNPNSISVKWAYKPDCAFPSLVKHGFTSSPCIFAGADSIGVPYFGENANFLVLKDGSLYASAAKIGAGPLGSANSIYLGTTDMGGVNGFFDGTSINNWRMTVGSNFGVTGSGKLYAKNADITGKINASEGDIGIWKIGDDCLEAESSYESGGSIIYEKIQLSPIGIKLWIKTSKSAQFADEPNTWATWNNLIFRVGRLWSNDGGDGFAKWW